MRSSHTHPRFEEDNTKVYYYVEEATRTMIYSVSITVISNDMSSLMNEHN